MIQFIVIATILLFIVGLIWSKDDAVNLLIKAAYLIAAMYGFGIILQHYSLV